VNWDQIAVGFVVLIAIVAIWLTVRGTKQSEETKERRAAKHRGRKNTPETIAKMRQSALNRSTAEYREKCSQMATKRSTPEYREGCRKAAFKRMAREDYALFGRARQQSIRDQGNLFD
jgi:hypothetical protein